MAKNFFKNLVELVVEDDDLFGVDGPCPISYEPGDNKSKLLIVTGENASGKSLALKAMSAYSSREGKKKVENMLIGMALRANSGFTRAIVYGGSEDEDSTGTLSVNAVLGALRNSSSREGRHLLLLDEPDIGLSEGYQKALGQRFHSFLSEAVSPLFEGLAIATHSRVLVEELLDLKPHLFRVGGDSRTTMEWIEKGAASVSLDDLVNLNKTQKTRWSVIRKILDSRSK